MRVVEQKGQTFYLTDEEASSIDDFQYFLGQLDDNDLADILEEKMGFGLEEVVRFFGYIQEFANTIYQIERGKYEGY